MTMTITADRWATTMMTMTITADLEMVTETSATPVTAGATTTVPAPVQGTTETITDREMVRATEEAAPVTKAITGTEMVILAAGPETVMETPATPVTAGATTTVPVQVPAITEVIMDRVETVKTVETIVEEASLVLVMAPTPAADLTTTTLVTVPEEAVQRTLEVQVRRV